MGIGAAADRRDDRDPRRRHVIGSVSGGCVEDDLIDRVKTLSRRSSNRRPSVLRRDRRAGARFGLPCGGTLQLVLEPVTAESRIEELLERVERHELVVRLLDM